MGNVEDDFTVIFPVGHPYCDFERLMAGITVLMGSSPVRLDYATNNSFIWPNKHKRPGGPAASIHMHLAANDNSIVVNFADENSVRKIERVVRYWKDQA